MVVIFIFLSEISSVQCNKLLCDELTFRMNEKEGYMPYDYVSKKSTNVSKTLQATILFFSIFDKAELRVRASNAIFGVISSHRIIMCCNQLTLLPTWVSVVHVNPRFHETVLR